MSKIIERFPYRNSSGFVMASYRVDPCSDADPESGAETPSAEERDAAWREYYAHVAETGLDPLTQFDVVRVLRRRATWDIEIREDEGRVVFVKARPEGFVGWIHDADALPAYVRDYLWLEDGVVLGSGSIHVLVGDCEADEDVSRVRLDGPLLRVTATVSHDEPRPVGEVRQDLRVAGRTALARVPGADAATHV